MTAWNMTGMKKAKAAIMAKYHPIRTSSCLFELLEQRLFLSTAPAAVATARNWTVLCYVDADNDLEASALKNINQMEAVVYPANVTVAVELDRIGGYATTNPDWTDTRRGEITHDTNLRVINSALTSIGEKDMSDPTTLVDFITWGINTYPAAHYSLIIWDHGSGLDGTCWDDSSGDDNLTVAEMTEALKTVQPLFAAQGTHLDMVGFDCCLMGMTEQYYDLAAIKQTDNSPFIDVLVASEESEPEDGWDYTNWLLSLAANPSMTASVLGTEAVEAYGNYYSGEGDVTLAALRTSTATTLATSLNNFAAAVLDSATTSADRTGIIAARDASPYFTDGYDRDLKDFMSSIAANTTVSSRIRSAATAVCDAVSSTVIANYAESTYTGTGLGTGLSICLPDSYNTAPDVYTPENFALLQDAPQWVFFTEALQYDLTVPTNITLSASSVAENQPSGTTVGTLSTTNLEVGDTFIYTLVSGTGSTDNTSFTITGNMLQTAASFNFEVKSSYAIRLRTTDQDGLYYEKAFTIAVTDVNEQPIIANQTFSIAENSTNGTAVATVVASDPDIGQTLTYSITAGNTCNAFAINASTGLLTVANSYVLNYEGTPTFALSVQIVDNGSPVLSRTATVTVNLSNVNEAPTVKAFAKSVDHDITVSFAAADFTAAFSDPDVGNSLQKVKITALPSHGILYLDTTAVTPNQEIIATDLSTLTYTPSSGYTGSDSFSWNSSDGSLFAAASASVYLKIGQKFCQDFNDDRQDDLIWRDGAGMWWVVTASNTQGSWGTWSTAVTWVDVNYVDLNGDGKCDIIGRTDAGAWWAGISDGSKFTNIQMGYWNPAANWTNVMAADVNGDGKTDVVGRTSTGAWWAGISDGTMLTNVQFGQWNPAATWVDIHVADVNGDGNADVIGRTGGQWWAGVSGGGRFANVKMGTWNNSVIWVNVNVADVNGDGKDDVIGRTGGAWYAGISDGTKFTNLKMGAWNPSLTWSDVRVADVNGDGLDDVIGRTSGMWYASISDGTKFTNKSFGSWSTAVTWANVKVLDLDGDGDDDVIGQIAGTNTWYAGISDGTKFTNVKWC